MYDVTQWLLTWAIWFTGSHTNLILLLWQCVCFHSSCFIIVGHIYLWLLFICLDLIVHPDDSRVLSQSVRARREWVPLTDCSAVPKWWCSECVFTHNIRGVDVVWFLLLEKNGICNCGSSELIIDIFIQSDQGLLDQTERVLCYFYNCEFFTLIKRDASWLAWIVKHTSLSRQATTLYNHVCDGCVI